MAVASIAQSYLCNMKLRLATLLSLVLFLVTASSTLNAQSTSTYSRVQIALEGKTGFHLQRLGLEVDHGAWYGHSYFATDLSEAEIHLLDRAGYKYKILIPDVTEHYALQYADRRTDDCRDVSALYDVETPDNFQLGTLAGYYRYTELLAELDKMRALYPELITERAVIEDHITHDGNQIFWLRMSDNAAQDQDKPEILFSSLHHAREPMSLSQLIFQMWYLLENYGTDDRVTYLLDNTEIYFIPCLNPDGYIFNEIAGPDGGALWRKNRRDNGNGIFGVDLNRNYGYEWGFDDQGSSPDSNRATYRGPAPFSEPETQAIRDFTLEHEFQIAINNHSFGNLLIYPFGFSDSPTPDQPSFLAMSKAMTRLNNFVFGTGSETVGYTVNGVSDDWFYAETPEKPIVYAMTPESGPGQYGFWPPMSEIERLAKESHEMNLTAIELLLDFTELTVEDRQYLFASSERIGMSLLRSGLQSGTVTLDYTSLSPSLVSVTGPASVTLNHLDLVTDSLQLFLGSDAILGETLSWSVSRTNAGYTITDTFSIIYGMPVLDQIYVDSIATLDAWSFASDNTSDWSLDTEVFFSAPSSMSDSPGANYERNASSIIQLAESVELPISENILLEFQAIWEIEPAYDYVTCDISTDGISWEPLCGLYTTLGTDDQLTGQPLYDGVQAEWVLESIDLSAYAGEEVSVRFHLVSDRGVEGEGFNFDDFTIRSQTEIISSVDNPSDYISVKVFPSPSISDIQVETDVDYDKLQIYDLSGRLALSYERSTSESYDVSPLSSGRYQILLYAEDGSIITSTGIIVADR